MPKHGRIPNPLDEAKALALLREGRAIHSIAAELRVGMRRIRALAEANGVPIRRRRSDAELAAQRLRIRKMREDGRSWRQVAAALGYANAAGAVGSILRRSDRETLLDKDAPRHAKRIKTLLRRLRKANNGRADGSDLPSFFRMAANPRMHWLLRPAEIELARAYRLLPAEDLRTSAEELIDRSLHMPPATPHPRMNLFASNF